LIVSDNRKKHKARPFICIVDLQEIVPYNRTIKLLCCGKAEEVGMNTVKKILKRRGGLVWSVNQTNSACDALHLMVEKDVGAVLVMEGETILGIVSERDIARKIVYRNLSAKSTPVSEIMTAPVYTVDADQTIETARALMTAHRVRHLPVLEKDKVIGVISTLDVVSEIIVIQRQTIEFYKDIAMDD
jgi:signal-transduction protein with cAMP-binding, CBS, and nucleotidyltransferase domain